MEDEKSIFNHLRPRKIETPDTAWFESLVEQIPAKNQVKPVRIISLQRSVLIWSLGAAAVLAIAVFNFVPDTNEEDLNLVAALQDIPDDDVYGYVESHLDEFDTELLIEVLPAEKVESVELDNPTEDLSLHSEPLPEEINFNSLEEEDILDYLESIGLEPTDLNHI